jgi:hypothetical protein
MSADYTDYIHHDQHNPRPLCTSFFNGPQIAPRALQIGAINGDTDYGARDLCEARTCGGSARGSA